MRQQTITFQRPAEKIGILKFIGIVVICGALMTAAGFQVYRFILPQYHHLAKPGDQVVAEASITFLQKRNVLLAGHSIPGMCKITYRGSANGQEYQGVSNRPFCWRFHVGLPVKVRRTNVGYDMLPTYDAVAVSCAVFIFAGYFLVAGIRRFRRT